MYGRPDLTLPAVRSHALGCTMSAGRRTYTPILSPSARHGRREPTDDFGPGDDAKRLEGLGERISGNLEAFFLAPRKGDSVIALPSVVVIAGTGFDGAIRARRVLRMTAAT